MFVQLAKEMESPQPLLTACEIHLLLGDYERAAEPVVTTEKDCLPKGGLFPGGYGSLQKKTDGNLGTIAAEITIVVRPGHKHAERRVKMWLNSATRPFWMRLKRKLMGWGGRRIAPAALCLGKRSGI